MKNRIPYKITFLLMGIAATAWFLVRIIPKPSRAGYPCMRAAAPVMSAFLIYLTTLFTAGFALKMARLNFRRSRYLVGIALFITAVISSGLFLGSNPPELMAGPETQLGVHHANEVMGTGIGVQPGRVAWTWDADATNENCSNSGADAYFYPVNNNQEVIDRMLSDVIQSLTGAETDSAAWSLMFMNFNGRKLGEPEWDYVEYEDIFIKTNATSTWGYPGGTYILADFSVRNTSNYIAETNPHVVLAMLRQLVNVVGVRQQNIWVGDPMKHIYKHAFDLWHSEFPDVNYIGSAAGDGRIKVEEGSEAVVYYSDKGTIMPGAVSDHLYTVMEQADYLINIPTLKAHARAGITLSAKNHFGSHTRGGAGHLHDGLVAPNEGAPTRTEMGLYRVQVDMMGHELIGGNTMLVLVDGLYAGPEATYPPDKWNMAPFNGDWASSLFASMDQVALESVCFDFLRTEYNNKVVKDGQGRNKTINFPNMAPGVDDYLEQAADPSKWPDGIVYDPEGDGEPITSLGAHEHWNNAENKQYSRNLGTEQGIELVSIPSSLVGGTTRIESSSGDAQGSLHVYPNPFTQQFSLDFCITEPSGVSVALYDLQGRVVTRIADEYYLPGEHTLSWEGAIGGQNRLTSGTYLVRMEITSARRFWIRSSQIQFIR